MRITVDDIRVVGRRAILLELDTLTLAAGECVLLAGEPGQGHTALALAATGRLRPYAGTVTLVDDDGSGTTSAASLRRATAVVDLPGISEPDDVVRVATIVTEDLAQAGRAWLPRASRRWLVAHELLEHRRDRFDELDGVVRTQLLASLAIERAGVRFLVITLPDRHGGEPAGWWSLAQGLAALGYGVLVQCSPSSARDLGASIPPARGTANRRATPIEALRTTPTLGPPPPPSGPPPSGPPPSGPPPSGPPPSKEIDR